MGEVLVDVAQRCPVGFGVATVDVAGDLFQLAAQLPVLGDVAARDRRDLQVGQRAALVRVALKIALEAEEALGQALGVIQAIHADRQLAITQAVAQILHRGLGGGGAGLACDQLGVDADRESRRTEAAPAGCFQLAVVEYAATAEQAQVGLETIGVALGLEADQIVGVQRGEQSQVVGHRLQQVGRRHRDVQEKADAAADAALAQQCAERDQVVVVDPDDVILSQQWRELVGEQRIDLVVGLAGAAVVVDQVQPEVQQWPQRAVGETIVVAIDFALAQVHGDVVDVTVLLPVQRAAAFLYGLAAPAEPQAAALLQGGQQADRQAACAVLAGHGHTI
ncbi:Uncharacterised protein [Stenotrophomonas maltophilia]|nr:Uncharacterised protein [Stenotrophomonas maltophilia]